MSSQYPEPTPLVPRRGAGAQPPGSKRSADQRIGDAERSAVCEELSAHYAAGRLSDAELDDRVTAAMAARTWADLRPLLGDLPSGTPGAAAPVPVAPRPGPATPWRALDILALVALIGTVCVALLGAFVVVLGGEPAYVVVAVLTAVTAGVGGMAATQVLHRGYRSITDRADQRRLSGPA